MSSKVEVPWRCEECGREVSDPRWYRADVEGEPPQLVAFCERCSEREFDRRGRSS